MFSSKGLGKIGILTGCIALASAALAATPAWQLDTSFAPVLESSAGAQTNEPVAVYQLERQADGKTIAVGYFDRVNGVSRPSVIPPVRFNTDGSTDTSFTPEMASAQIDRFRDWGTIDAAGRRYITTSNGTLGRLAADGTPDPSFQSDVRIYYMGSLTTKPFALMPDGSVIILASTDFYSLYDFVRLLPDGSRDATFNFNRDDAGFFTDLQAMVPLPDGRLLLLGTETTAYNPVINFARLDMTGKVDYRYVTPASWGETRTDNIFAIASVFYDLLRDAHAPPEARLHFQNSYVDATVDVGADGLALISTHFWLTTPLFGRYKRVEKADVTVDARPTISIQPSAKTTAMPDSALGLSVFAGGLFPLHYQWFKDGQPLAGATAPSFFIKSFQASDIGKYTVLVSNSYGWVSSQSASVALKTDPNLLAITEPLNNSEITTGKSFILGVTATSNLEPTFTWTRNGVPITPTFAGSGGSIVMPVFTSFLYVDNAQLADAGLYRVIVSDGRTTEETSAILGVASTAKAIGAAEVVATDIHHPNGNVYDQVLLTGPSATITADPGKVTRISYVDLTDDIVQVEFSGAGSLTLSLDPSSASGPAAPVNYNQPNVRYMRGHATLTISGADDTTNASVFTVGTANAINQALFRLGVSYDGVADITSIAIASINQKFGGLWTGDTCYIATQGLAGIYAPGVQFTGPLILGDVASSESAKPALVFGHADDVRVAGGAIDQTSGSAVTVSGLSFLNFTAGANSHGDLYPAKTTPARFTEQGVDVTSLLLTPR